MVRYGRLGTARRGTVKYGEAWLGTAVGARLGEAGFWWCWVRQARLVKQRYGSVWCGLVMAGMAR